MKGEERHSYRFKSFRLDVGERQLLNHERPVPLTPKAFAVLALLVERSGHLVEKGELLKLVWVDSIVEEANVARTVHTLRRILGEDENGNKFIETVAKKGYRFIAKVTETGEQPALRQANGDKHSSIEGENVTVSNLTPATAETETRNDKAAQSVPAPKPRVILFGIGFLTAVFLLLTLSLNFRSGSTVDSNKIKSIAVLPLKPINAEARNELYEIGTAESIIHRLSTTKSFYVRPLSATRQYTDPAQDPIAAGREQKVDYVLASNYQIADGKIRITSQLFNVANGQIEETYKSEKDAKNVFAVQDAIAGEVGNLLQTRFATTSSGTVARRGTTNEEAYRLYLHGNNLTMKRSQADAQKAIEYFGQAIQLDPNFALAYVGMARAFGASGSLRGGRAREAYEKARAAVNKAVELDANLADVYVVRGDLKLKYEWDFAGAEKDLISAIELEPNNDLAHEAYALLLNHNGRFKEALAEIEIALEINPNSLVHQRERGRFFYFARRYDEAIVHLERVLEVDENFNTAFHWLIVAYEMKGDFAGAFEWLIKDQKQRNPERINDYQKAYETGGWQNVNRKILEFEKLNQQTAINHYLIARQHARLNEKEQAFESLNKALEAGQSQMAMLKVEPAFDSLRDDARFVELLRRVGFK